jgi:hypothetical protein
LVIAVEAIEDKAFSLESTKDYNLSLLLGPDRLSYLILSGNQLMALGSYAFEAQNKALNLIVHLDEVLKKDPKLKADYKHSLISLYSRRFTILPKVLYDPAATNTYFEAVLPLNAQDKLHVDELISPEAVLIYALDTTLEHWLKQHFPNADYRAAASATIAAAPSLLEEDNYSALVLMKSRSFCLTVLHKKQLILHQVYGFSSSEDCLYHILNAYKQLGLSTEKQKLWLGGELVKDSEIYKLLFKYIRHIDFVDRPAQLQYSSDFAQLPAHFYYDLFCAQLP